MIVFRKPISTFSDHVLKPIAPADIGTDNELPITFAIAAPVIPCLRRERTDGRSLLDRRATCDDCACILTAKDISKGRETDGGDRNAHGYLLECFAGV